jgi:hypothetical protein
LGDPPRCEDEPGNIDMVRELLDRALEL